MRSGTPTAEYSPALFTFFTLFLAFARFFPVLALNELKTILKTSGENYKKQQANH